jgi:hypothetical protein
MISFLRRGKMKRLSKNEVCNRFQRTTKITSLLLLMIFYTASIARADYFNLAWGIQYGTAGDEHYYYEDVGVDSAGNIYAMWTTGAESPPTTTYMKKIDPMGNLIWQTSEQRNYNDCAIHLKMDLQNNYCIFGHTTGPSGGTYYGWTDGFVRKYDSDGQLLWARQLGTSGYETILNGTFDSQGNIYVCGDNTVVAKYDRNGNLQFVKQFDIYPYYDSEQAQAIEVSSTGEIYVGATISNSGAESSSQTALLKLDSNGNLIWTREMGVAGIYDGGFMFAGFDTQGRIVFRVHTKGALGGAYLGGYDIALGRCDSSGNVEWIGQYGTSVDDFVCNALIDSSNYIIAIGFTRGSFFGINHGSNDAYIMQIAAEGNILGGSQFGTTGDDVLIGLSSNGTDYYVSGSTDSNLWGPNAGGRDVILGKFNLEPTNDEKADAIAVEVNDVVNGWTVGATGTDITLNGYNDSNDVWYYFEPNEAGKYTIEVYDATFDTTLGVFDEGNKEVAFNDDFWGEKSVVILKAKAGKRYYIRVAGYDEETGDFTMRIYQGAVQAIQGDINYDGNVDFSDFASFADSWLMGN